MTVETHSAIAPIQRDWDEFADRVSAPPWLRAGWIEAWWRAFGNGDVHIATIRREGEISALVPLFTRGATLSSTTNWHTPDFRILAADEDARQEALDAVYGHGSRRVTIAFVDPADAELCAAAAHQHGFSTIRRTLERPPFLSTDGDFQAYEETLDRKVVSEIRRRRRRLEEQADLTFHVEDGTQGLERLLEEGFRVEASGWKGEAGTAILSSEETRRFYTDLARWNAENGWLRLAFLRLGGRAIAFQYLVEYGGVVSQLKGGYDDELRKFAPGTILLQDVVRWAFEGASSRYEFLGAEEGFKLEWARGQHDRQTVEAYARSVPGRVDYAAWKYGRPLAKRIRALVRR